MTTSLLSRLLAAAASLCVTFSLLFGVLGLAEPQPSGAESQAASSAVPQPVATARAPA